jgi:hypothetical protein
LSLGRILPAQNALPIWMDMRFLFDNLLRHLYIVV